MKILFTILVYTLGLHFSVFAQLPDSDIRDPKAGRVKPDTSPIYVLPYSTGRKYLLIQGYNSRMSHAGELSLDFKMKPGTKIIAARAGVVEAMREDSDRGGLNNKFMNDGNHIIVRHDDGSMAMYWHLQKQGVLVN